MILFIALIQRQRRNPLTCPGCRRRCCASSSTGLCCSHPSRSTRRAFGPGRCCSKTAAAKIQTGFPKLCACV